MQKIIAMALFALWPKTIGFDLVRLAIAETLGTIEADY